MKGAKAEFAEGEKRILPAADRGAMEARYDAQGAVIFESPKAIEVRDEQWAMEEAMRRIGTAIGGAAADDETRILWQRAIREASTLVANSLHKAFLRELGAGLAFGFSEADLRRRQINQSKSATRLQIESILSAPSVREPDDGTNWMA